eukprot:633626-Amorphochlora_amoeboformis.AAC.1
MCGSHRASPLPLSRPQLLISLQSVCLSSPPEFRPNIDAETLLTLQEPSGTRSQTSRSDGAEQNYDVLEVGKGLGLGRALESAMRHRRNQSGRRWEEDII